MREVVQVGGCGACMVAPGLGQLKLVSPASRFFFFFFLVKGVEGKKSVWRL